MSPLRHHGRLNHFSANGRTGQRALQRCCQPGRRSPDVPGAGLPAPFRGDGERLNRGSRVDPPSDPLEAGTLNWLTPGAYTAVVRGNGGQTGVGLIDIYSVK